MKISVFSPVKNESEFIGYSVMAVLPYVHEILYGVADSDDGTYPLLLHIAQKYGQGKLKLYRGMDPKEPNWDFDPMDMKAYNAAYNYLIDRATGDAVWFLHPDMIVTNPEVIPQIKEGPLAWYINLTSYARDAQTQILRGRCKQWKNLHVKDFGLHYWGGYGSQDEDLYFRDITGDSYKFSGWDFESAPYEIADSGIHANHYCELKSYERRLEKMIRCLRTQHPKKDLKTIQEMAAQHPRVTLEQGVSRFGEFRFGPAAVPPPDVFAQYKEEFEAFNKSLEGEPVCP